MRYRIDFDRVINQLSPYYLSGRKLILYLQAIMKPLQILSDGFTEWAKETKIEATMTSQIFKLEWYLNRKFRKYFKDSEEQIIIKNGKRPGVPLYFEAADVDKEKDMLVRYESEGAENTVKLNFSDELTEESECSFFVYSPQINDGLISKEEYTAMLSYCVDRYRIAGKTYKIKFNLQ
jgi:hypothetical protein